MINVILERLSKATPEQLTEVKDYLENKTWEGPQDRKLLSLSQAAKALGVTRVTAWRYAKENKIKRVPTRGSRGRITSQSVTDFVNGKGVTA